MQTAIGGLPHLFEVIGQSPHPDEVARAIVDGPGRAFGATSAAVLWARPPKLVIVGTFGYRPQEVDGLATVDIDGDYPLTLAYLEGEPVITPSSRVEQEFASMRRSGSRWRHLRERIPDGDHVSAPITSDGHSIGAFALNCPQSHVWSTTDIACLDATSHALGMWLTHPDSGMPVEEGLDVIATMSLTPRQQHILSLVHAGRTNASIAHGLGISVSTVKQEISGIMTLLDVTDRRAAALRAIELDLLEGPPP